MTLEQFKNNLELINQIETIRAQKKQNSNINTQKNNNIIPYSNEYINETKNQKKGDWLGNIFQGAKNWEDGYDFGDVTKTIGASALDVTTNIFNSVAKGMEGISKLGAQGIAQVADWTGHDEFADAMRKEIANENSDAYLSPKITAWKNKYLEPYSVLGNTTDAVAEGVGSTIFAAATAPIASPSIGKLKNIPVVMGLSSAGHEVSEAFSKEDVQDWQAWLKGGSSGTVEALSESIFGAFGIGGSELDDVLVKKATKNISNTIAKAGVTLGIKAGGESAEEFLSYAGNYLSNRLIDGISSKTDAKARFSEDWNWDEVAQSMATAFVSSALTQGPSNFMMASKGIDVTTGNTIQVQSQIDQEVQSQIQALEKKGEKVNTAKKLEIERNATEKIYLNNAKQELVDTVNKSENIDNTLKKGIVSNIESLKDLKNVNLFSNMINKLESSMQKDIQNKQSTPINSVKAPVERDIARQTFLDSAKTNNIDVKNNTEVLDSMFEMAYQRGVNISIDDKVFNNENQNALWRVNQETGQREVVINPNNPQKALQSITIHELTHDMENTEAYEKLSKVVLDYAKRQNNYDNAFRELSDMYAEEYKKYKGEEFTSKINQEMVADILGEKLGNQEFVNNLVSSNRGVAQSIYGWIVDKLNKVNKLTGYRFEKLYWADVKNKFDKAFNTDFNNYTGDIKYSINNIAKFNEMKYNNAKEVQLSKQNYGILIHAISSDTSIVPGLNKITLFDYEADKYVTYTFYYKNEVDRPKVIKRIEHNNIDYFEEEANEYNKSSSKSSERNEESRSRQTDNKWDNDRFNYRRTADGDAEISNINTREGSIKERSDRKSIGNKSGIENIKEKYKDKTDYFVISESKEKISLDNLVIKKELRNKGIGQQILNDIIEYANENNKRITLTPTSEFGTKERLKKWYKKNGFVENKGRNTDFLISDTMYKNPEIKNKKELAPTSSFLNENLAPTRENILRKIEDINKQKEYLKNDIEKNVPERTSKNNQKNNTRINEYLAKAYPSYHIDYTNFKSDGTVVIHNIQTKTQYENERQEVLKRQQEQEENKRKEAYKITPINEADEYHLEYSKLPSTENEFKALKDIRNKVKEIVENINKNYKEKGFSIDYEESRNSEDATYITINKDGKEDYVAKIRLGNHFKGGVSSKGDYNIDLSEYTSKQAVIKDLNEYITGVISKNDDTKYSKSNTGAYQKFLQDNFSNGGTKTYMKDIKLPSKISNLKNELRNIVNTSDDMDVEMKDSLLKLINEVNTEAELQSYREDLKPQKAPVKSGTIKITNYKNAKLNSKIVDNALSMIEANKQGRRTKSQWLQVAEQIGMNIKESEIDKYAYKTWSDFLPNQKSNLNRQGEKYVTFTKDEWIKAVEDGYSKANSKKATTRENNKEKVKNTIPPITNDQLKITFERNVDNALKNKSSKGNTILGKVKLNIALKIKDILGIDVSNRIHRLSDYDIRHIMNQHSDADKEAIKGQIPISSSDIKKIPDIIENPSDIVKGTDNKLGETIRYIKEYNDNTTFVVEVVPENSADLIIKTMWKKPSTLTNIENNLSSTSKTKGSDISSTINNIIPSEQNYVNNTKKTMNPIEIANLKPEDVSSTPDLQSKNYEKGDKESKFYKNITNNSKFLNSELRKELKNEDDIKYYKSVTNEESLTEALKRLDNDGASETSRWFSKKDKFTSSDVAEGYILLKRYQDAGDYKNATEVAKKMRDIGTTAGQTIQAFNILNRLTPEGMTMYSQKILSDTFEEFKKNKTQEWIKENEEKFNLTAEEQDFIKEKVNEASKYDEHSYERRVALAEIQKMMEDKLPTTLGKEVKSWMRIAMLCNPKTQVRNVTGNAIIVPVNAVSDFFASGMDKYLSKFTGVRTTGNVNVKSLMKGAIKGAYEATNDYKKGINTKNIDGNRFEISKGKSFTEKTIVGKSLNNIENLLNYVMDAGDRVFSEAWFENSIANQLELNNTTEITQEMIDIATQEALSRTWNDNNNYTKLVLNIRKALNGINVGGYGLGDVLIPFAKTPANLTKAIVDYSPAGLVNSLVQGVKLKNSISTGQVTAQQQHKFVQDLGKATAGTILYVLGYALAKAGITTGDSDEDKDAKNFIQKTLGISSYSINIGGKSFTYDWAQPIAAPLSITANIVNSKNKEKALYEAVVSNLDTAGSILLEQSFLSSINDVLSNNDGFVSGLINEVLELPARAIPTFSKQIADLVDGTQRQTFVKGSPIKSAGNQMLAKIPFASRMLAPTVDTLGNEVKKYGGKNNIFNVMFNPANVNSENISEAGKEIYKIYQKTGDKTIFPRTADYSLTYDGENYNLSTQERAEYQKIMGKYVDNTVSELIKSQDYQNLDNKEKAKIINEIVSDGNEIAKLEYAKQHNLKYERTSTDLKVENEIEKGLNVANAYVYKANIRNIEGNKDLNGKTINGTATNNKINYIMDMEISDTQKQHLVNLLTDNVDYNLSVNDLNKLNGDYLTYINQSGKVNENSTYSPREEYMAYINAGIPVKQLNKFYEQIGSISAIKNKYGKTISGSKKQLVFNYINSLKLSIPQKMILLAKQYSSFGRKYIREILEYISSSKMSKKEKIKLIYMLYKS